MDNWLADLRLDLQSLEERSLLRRLRPMEQRGKWLEWDGRRLLNLAGNDYLGLSAHPRLVEAACAAIREHGVGAGASRLVSGHGALTARVERRFAAFKEAEAALICPTGYMANLAVMTTLAGKGDLVCLDKLNHASLIDAARASGAMVRIFPHLHTGKLARLLEQNQRVVAGESSNPKVQIPNRQSHRPRAFIVTDTVFSMDGDVADLPALAELAERFDAILVVDEAHGTGVLGEHGGGLCEVQGVAGRVDVVISTASKAMGGLGGIVTARQEVIDAIVNHARAFIYTTAVPPAQAAVIDAALDVMRDEPERRGRLGELSRRVRGGVASLGWLVAPVPRGLETVPIIPLVVGDAVAALALADHLQSRGFFAPAIRPPTIAPGAARVRVTLRADLDDRDINSLLDALRAFRPPV